MRAFHYITQVVNNGSVSLLIQTLNLTSQREVENNTMNAKQPWRQK